MNLDKKKKLAVRTFGIGKSRIIFLESRLDDIKDAITKQDIRDLVRDGAIVIKEIGGRRRKKAHGGRGIGKIRKQAISKKRDYIVLTRKLRKYIMEMKNTKKLSKNVLEDMRKRIRNRDFRSREHLKEYLKELNIELKTGGARLTPGTRNENSKKKKKK